MIGTEYQSRYQEIEQIGRNAQDNSQMFLVKDKQEQEYRMAKKIMLAESDLQQQNKLLNEVALLKDLNHPHVLRYYDILLEQDTLISLLQFCEDGDLNNYLIKKKTKKEGFTQKLLLSWLMQLLMGLQYIHSKHIVHRLIATRNVYLNHQGDLKIGSFGSAKVLENTLKKAVTVVTAPCNMSPEMVQGDAYNSKADIWALGCLVYEMAALKPLFHFGNLAQLYDLIVEKPTPELPLKYGKYLNPIFRKMMKKSPSQRSSASELLQEQVFVPLMKQYVKKKRIDSLDLKYIVPKRLTIHKNKSNQQLQTLKLPPISTNRQNNNSPMFNKTKTSCKTEIHSQSRSYSKEGKKTLHQNTNERCQQQEGEEIPQRITKINQAEGLNISHLYQAKLIQIMDKYKPNMSLIYEKTFDFQQNI